MISSAIWTLILFIVIASPFASSSHCEAKVEEIGGSVIAYDEIQANWIPCYEGDCEGSLIVRIGMPNEAIPGYIRVDFKYKAGKFPKKLIRSKQVWRFRLERTQHLDQPLYEYVIQAASSYSAEKKYAIWKLIPGAEREQLPFDQRIPSYSLGKGGFKLVKEK